VAIRNYQEMLAELQRFWSDYGCVILTPYHTELGAGTMNPATFLRCLGPEPWRTYYLEPSIRPMDGRYGENPIRFQQFLQGQAVFKPAPDDILDVYFRSLEALGVDLRKHDLRLVEDDWEAPTLGAWGLGWEVWLDGMEITQWTYFQQLGGFEVELVPAEITYGLDRLSMFLFEKESVMDVEWAPGFTWGDVFRENERQFSAYNFEAAPVDVLARRFTDYETEANDLLDRGLVLPAYDQVLKANHAFNLLDARGALSVAERAAYIARVRNCARRVAEAYLGADREARAA
jgi:glycyl-tRNA synthetase alpha chain